MLKVIALALALAVPATAHAGWSFRTDGNDEFFVSYSIDLHAKPNKRTCRNDYWRIGVNTVVHAIANSMVRGSSRVGDILPTGATLSGHAIAWAATSSLYDLPTTMTIGLIASDVFSEQIEGWADELDIGLVEGDPWEETAGFAKHLARARAGSITMIDHHAGWSSDVMTGYAAIGALGYKYGADLKKKGKLPDGGEFKQHYRIGEVATGAAFGYGVAKTLDCRS
jgi:hypothetical protein